MCSAKTKCTLVRIKLAIAFCYAMNFEMFKLDLEKAEKPEMETHSSVLAWRIPGMGEPDGLPSMGSQSRTRLKRLSSSSSSRGTRDQIASICWIFKKSRVPEKTSTSALLIVPKPLTVWITTNWKILHKMGIPDDLTCLLRNLYAGQEETIRTGHGTTDWFQIGKGVRQGCILSPCLFNLYQSRSYEMPGWMTHKLESRLSGKILITSDKQMTIFNLDILLSQFGISLLCHVWF